VDNNKIRSILEDWNINIENDYEVDDYENSTVDPWNFVSIPADIVILLNECYSIQQDTTVVNIGGEEVAIPSSFATYFTKKQSLITQYGNFNHLMINE